MPLMLRTAFIISKYYTRWVREKDSPFNFSINRGIHHGIMNVKLNTVNKTRNLQNGPKLIRCLLHGILFRDRKQVQDKRFDRCQKMKDGSSSHVCKCHYSYSIRYRIRVQRPKVLYLTEGLSRITLTSSSTLAPLGRVYYRARPCGISAISKKMPHKIYIAASNWAHKNRP